jgi:hypothetical protein
MDELTHFLFWAIGYVAVIAIVVSAVMAMGD